MNFQNAIENVERFVLNHVDSASTVLVFMGILGTVTSSLAQQASIRKNKDLPKDKKEFLINQEQKDCLLSASLTWLVSKCAKEGINYLTNNGYLLNNSVRDITDGIAKNYNMTHRELAKTGFFKIKTSVEQEIDNFVTFAYDKCKGIVRKPIHLYNFDKKLPSKKFKVKQISRSFISPDNISKYPELKKNFKRCQDGLGVIGAVAASILTTNLIVPIFRNLLIKKNIEAKKVEEQPVSIERIMTDRYMPRVFKNDAQLTSLCNIYPSSNLRI